MRKLSNAFLLVGGIIAFVLMACFLLGALACFLFNVPIVVEMVHEALLHFMTPEEAEKAVLAAQAGSIAGGVTLIFFAALCIPSGVVALKARNNPTQGLLVANIVFGLISCSEFNVAGAILGLIRNAREERNQKREEKAKAEEAK